MSRSRYWCFTLNNYTYADLCEFVELPGTEVSYRVVGLEVGSNGTQHLQGYLEFCDRLRLSAVRRVFAGRAHWEPRRGNSFQAASYCKKDACFIEAGSRTEQSRARRPQGQDSALHESSSAKRRAIYDIIGSGRGVRGIILELGEPTLQHIKLGERLRGYVRFGESECVPTVLWIFGATGVGKSRCARARVWSPPEEWTVRSGRFDPDAWSLPDESYMYVKCGDTKWFDGIDGNPDRLILDDYRSDWYCGFNWLLMACDRYEFNVEMKGESQWLRPKQIVITTCHPVDATFGNCIEELAQLKRRISAEIEFR